MSLSFQIPQFTKKMVCSSLDSGIALVIFSLKIFLEKLWGSERGRKRSYIPQITITERKGQA